MVLKEKCPRKTHKNTKEMIFILSLTLFQCLVLVLTKKGKIASSLILWKKNIGSIMIKEVALNGTYILSYLHQYLS